MKSKTTFTKNMKMYRQFLGFSQEKLSQISGLDMSYIGRIERGVVCPTIATAERISDAMNISLSCLLSENFDTNINSYAIAKWENGTFNIKSIKASKINSQTKELLDSLF